MKGDHRQHLCRYLDIPEDSPEDLLHQKCLQFLQNLVGHEIITRTCSRDGYQWAVNQTCLEDPNGAKWQDGMSYFGGKLGSTSPLDEIVYTIMSLEQEIAVESGVITDYERGQLAKHTNYIYGNTFMPRETIDRCVGLLKSRNRGTRKNKKQSSTATA